MRDTSGVRCPLGVGAQSISASADGSLLAAGGLDRRLDLWDVETGQLRMTINLGSIIADATFAPDGSELLVALDHGIVQRLTLDTEELVTLARTRAVRSMTEDECRTYLDVERCSG